MATTRPWFEELAVTPLIVHAAQLLREAIPRREIAAGAIGIRVGFAESGFEGGATIVYRKRRPEKHVPLTNELTAAACLLAAAFGLHQAAIRKAYRLSDEDDSHNFPACRVALDQLNTRARNTWKMEGDEFYYYPPDSSASGGVIVYL